MSAGLPPNLQVNALSITPAGDTLYAGTASGGVFAFTFGASVPNYQGLWWNPDESGWGINFAHQGDIIFATWFTYDASGKPWWLIAELHKGAAKEYTGGVSTVSGAPFIGVTFDSSKVVETPAGTAAATFTNGNAATFAYTVNGAAGSKAVTRQVFMPPGTSCQ
jgi:hypothetical protein